MRIRRDTLLEAVDVLLRFTAPKRIRSLEEFKQVHFRGDAIIAGNGDRFAKVALTSGLRCGVMAGNLERMLRNLASPYVELTLDGDRLHLRAGRTSATFVVTVEPNTLDEQEWGADAERVAIPDGLIGAMNLVGFAASRDINTGVYRGALFRGDRVVATDRVQIASVRLDAAPHPELVVDRSNVKLLASYRDRLSQYCVKGEWSVFSGERLTFAFKRPAGEYTDKVSYYLEESRQLGHSVVLPAGLESAVRRQLHQQGKVPDLDREVELDVDSTELTVHSTDGVRYELEETVKLPAVAGKFHFVVHPQYLLNALRVSRRMHYDTTRDSSSDRPESPLVAFRSAGMEYLTTVEHKGKQEPTEAQS